MTAITVDRKSSGIKNIRGAKKAVMFGAAATTAVAMAMGTTSVPEAKAITIDGTTSGPLLWLVSQLGVDSITIPNIPVVGSITVNLNWNEADSVGLYDAINSSAFGSYILGNATRPNLLASGATGPLMIADGQGTIAALQAYAAMLASANGNTPEGYTPLTASGKVNSITGQPCSSGLTCVQGTNITNLPMVLVNNYGTPNGGFNARFQQLFNLFGVDPVSPNAGSGSSTGIRLNSAFINVALGYNAAADFPATANIFSLANTLMATFLPTYLLGGGALKGADQDTIVGNLIGLLSLGTPSTSYSTFDPTDLPLLEAMRLPVRLINLIGQQLGLDIDLPTPIADALEPALRILVNIGYTDVQTPTEGGTYNRTFDQSATNTPWLSVNPLTPEEWAKVPGDVFHALIDGIVNEIHTLFGGEPSTEEPDTETPAAASVAAAASESPAAEADSAADDVAAAASDNASDDAPSSITSTGPARGGAAAGKPSRKATPSASAQSSSGSASSDNDGPASAHRGLGGSKRAKTGDAA